MFVLTPVQDAKAKEEAFVPEVDEDEEDQSTAQRPAPEPVLAHSGANGRPGSASAAGQQQPAAGDTVAKPHGPLDSATDEAATAPAAAAVAAVPEPKQEQSTLHRLAAEVPGTAKFGLEVRSRPGPGQLLSREELRAQRAAAARTLRGVGDNAVPQNADSGDAGVLADLARLQRAGHGSGEVLDEDMSSLKVVAAPEWRPPQGQQGDGRTKLNDLLGY